MNRREKIKQKTQGRCGYCGNPLPEKGWHVDHVEPIYRGWKNRPDRAGEDEESNMMAACQRCNLWKKTLTVELFRTEIAMQSKRLRRDSAPFRLAEDFGVIAETETKVTFYFESADHEELNSEAD